MGIPIGNNGVLQHAKIDMSHQEMARLVEHLEQLWQGCEFATLACVLCLCIHAASGRLDCACLSSVLQTPEMVMTIPMAVSGCQLSK